MSPVCRVTLVPHDASDEVGRRTLDFDPNVLKFKVGRSSKSENKQLVPASNNVWVDSPVMSREHAEICAMFGVNSTGKPLVYIRDVSSMHGTFYNGERLKPCLSTFLTSKDTVTFGSEVVRGVETFQPCTFSVEINVLDTPLLFPPVTFISSFSVPEPESDEESDEDFEEGGSDYTEDDALSLEALTDDSDSHSVPDDDHIRAITPTEPRTNPQLQSSPVTLRWPPTVYKTVSPDNKDDENQGERSSPLEPETGSFGKKGGRVDRDGSYSPTDSIMPISKDAALGNPTKAALHIDGGTPKRPIDLRGEGAAKQQFYVELDDSSEDEGPEEHPTSSVLESALPANGEHHRSASARSLAPDGVPPLAWTVPKGTEHYSEQVGGSVVGDEEFEEHEGEALIERDLDNYEYEDDYPEEEYDHDYNEGDYDPGDEDYYEENEVIVPDSYKVVHSSNPYDNWHGTQPRYLPPRAHLDNPPFETFAGSKAPYGDPGYSKKVHDEPKGKGPATSDPKSSSENLISSTATTDEFRALMDFQRKECAAFAAEPRKDSPHARMVKVARAGMAPPEEHEHPEEQSDTHMQSSSARLAGASEKSSASDYTKPYSIQALCQAADKDAKDIKESIDRSQTRFADSVSYKSSELSESSTSSKPLVGDRGTRTEFLRHRLIQLHSPSTPSGFRGANRFYGAPGHSFSNPMYPYLAGYPPRINAFGGDNYAFGEDNYSRPTYPSQNPMQTHIYGLPPPAESDRTWPSQPVVPDVIIPPIDNEKVQFDCPGDEAEKPAGREVSNSPSPASDSGSKRKYPFEAEDPHYSSLLDEADLPEPFHLDLPPIDEPHDPESLKDIATRASKAGESHLEASGSNSASFGKASFDDFPHAQPKERPATPPMSPFPDLHMSFPFTASIESKKLAARITAEMEKNVAAAAAARDTEVQPASFALSALPRTTISIEDNEPPRKRAKTAASMENKATPSNKRVKTVAKTAAQAIACAAFGAAGLFAALVATCPEG
ncbi:MAG: TOM (translocase of outer membrane) complex component [Chaenotheca gracillima]|nr:MAG: TOM (translocase of outer membrane) complex component [Chaenotheca gracillima]